MNYQELIERWRKAVISPFYLGPATDVLESLLVENERLKAELAKYGKDGQWAYDEIVSLRKQRDELLAELQRFMDSHEECTDFDGFTAQIVSMADYHQAQEAIARAKGEQ